MEHKKRIGFEVRALNNLIKRDVERSKVFQKTTGLHGWAIGWLIENRDKEIFQRDFEERFSIRRSTASNILALMEKNGMIVRQSVERDARLKRIMLTERAVEIHKEIECDIKKREQRLTVGLSSEEIDTFFNIISKLKANLEEEDD